MERDDTIAEPAQASEQETAAPAGKKTRRLAGVRIFSSASDAPIAPAHRRVAAGVRDRRRLVLSFSAPGPTASDTAASDLLPSYRASQADLSRTDALYLSVTILSTVGFGDISATSQSARLAVTSQMILDLLVLGIGINAFVHAARVGRDRQSSRKEIE